MDYKKKIWNKNFGALAISVMIAGGILLPAHFAGAGLFEITTAPFALLASWIINLIGWIFGVTLLPFAGYLVNQVFGAGEFINNGLVRAGWEISRDIANMFFILILIAIGFATTLRMESYGIKRLLPRLIIIALLINFSLVIGGIFIDMGNSIGYFFTHGGISELGEENVGTNIMAAMQLSKSFDIPTDSMAAEWNALFVRRLMSMILVIVATFILFAMAFIMLFRMIHLWILLILSPLAWAAYILPGTSSWWSKWWSDFLKWAFFPAIYGFFIYLALLSTLGFSATELFDSFPKDIGIETTRSTLPFSNMRFFLQYLTVIFILVTGLVLANKWSLAGASTMMKLGVNMRNAAGKYTKKAALGTAGFAVKSVIQKIPEETRAGVRETLEKTRIPLIGRALGGPGARYKAKQAAIKAAEEKIKSMRPQDLEARLNQSAFTPEDFTKRAAILKKLAKDGKLTGEHKKYFKGYLNAGGGASDILKQTNWAFDGGIQETLISHSSTKETWKDIAGSEAGSEERKEAVRNVYSEKIMPKKPKDFADIAASHVDVDAKKPGLVDPVKWTKEIKSRQELLDALMEKFIDGKELFSSHLRTAAGNNHKLHTILLREIEKREDDMPTHIQSYLASPGGQTFTEEKPSEAPEATPSKES